MVDPVAVEGALAALNGLLENTSSKPHALPPARQLNTAVHRVQAALNYCEGVQELHRASLPPPPSEPTATGALGRAHCPSMPVPLCAAMG